jgi:hypothetical protein
MPRGLTSDQKAQLGARIKRIATFVEVDIEPDIVRMWDGLGPQKINGDEFAGVGELGMIDGMGNERGTVANAISMSLHGMKSVELPDGSVKAIRESNYQGRRVTIWHSFTNIDTDKPILTPFVVWIGVADVMTLEVGEQFTVTLTAEHYSSRLRRVCNFRMNSGSHNRRIKYLGEPRDGFFDHNSRLNVKKAGTIL